MMDVESYLILTATFSFAFIILGYEQHARMNGWSVGELFSFGGTFHLISGFIAASVLVEAFYLFSWWSPIAVLAGGFVAGLILSNVFKQNVQPISLIGTVVGWIASISLL